MTWIRPIFCSRCTALAVVLIEGGRTGRYAIRSAVACDQHRSAVEKWGRSRWPDPGDGCRAANGERDPAGATGAVQPRRDRRHAMTDDNTYPMPRPDDDPRFTLGLIFDVRQAIVDHGYPDIRHPLDLVNLQQALFRYLYAPAEAE